MNTNLADERCVACRADSSPVSAATAQELLTLLPNWQIVCEGGMQRLSATFAFEDFAAALAFANRIGELAEAADHHPLIVVEWGRVGVQWWTHAIGGLHRNDFIMAARCAAAVDPG